MYVGSWGFAHTQLRGVEHARPRYSELRVKGNDLGTELVEFQ